MKRVWYWPPWKLAEPWKPALRRAGDEFHRTTLVVGLPFLGWLIVADPRGGLTDDEYFWLVARRDAACRSCRKEMA